MADGQLLLGEAPLEKQIKFEHDFGDVFLTVNRLQGVYPLFPGIADELVDVALAIPPSLLTSSNNFWPANTLDMPPADLLNDQLSLQLGGFETHGFGG